MPPKKSKGQPMSLALGTNWADDVEDLPTAPSRETNIYASTSSDQNNHRSDRRQFPIPDKPPYTVFVGNLSFDTSESDLETLFRDLSIANIRLIREDDKPKGFGYIEFSDRASLEDALKYSNESVRGRPIRIDVAEQKERPNRRGGFDGDRGGQNRDPVDDAKFEIDWRAGAGGPLPIKAREDKGFGNASKHADNFGGGDRQGQDRNNNERGRNTSERGPTFERKASPDRDWTRVAPKASQPREAPAPRSNQRKHLAMLPRTTPLESSASPPILSSKPSPFGAAKPRDGAEIQRKFEERKLAEKLEQVKLDESTKKDGDWKRGAPLEEKAKAPSTKANGSPTNK